MRRTDGGTRCSRGAVAARAQNAGAVAPRCTVLCKLGSAGGLTGRGRRGIRPGLMMGGCEGGLVDWRIGRGGLGGVGQAGGVEVVRLRVPPSTGIQTRQEERGFEPDLGLGLDLTWLARVRQKVSVVLYSCMVQRSECLVLCARGRLRPCALDGLFRTARRGALRRLGAGRAGRPGGSWGGGGAGSWEEGGRGEAGWQNGAGLIPRGPRVTLADALLATEQCETEKDAVGGGPGLEPRPGPADGVCRFTRSTDSTDGQQTSEWTTDERMNEAVNERANHPASCVSPKRCRCRKPPWQQMHVSCKLRAEWKAKNGRWSGTRSTPEAPANQRRRQ